MLRRWLVVFAVVVAAHVAPGGTTAAHAAHGRIPTNAAVGFAVTPSGDGYWVLREAGFVEAFGDAPDLDPRPHLSQPAVALASTATGNGLWIAAADGGVFAYGDAPFHGSAVGVPLAAPVVDIAASASGNGYFLLAADGGVFTFGDARFFGSGVAPCSTCGERAQDDAGPAEGITTHPSGNGYWIAYHRGSVQPFGAADDFGQIGSSGAGHTLDVAATPTGNGYWLVDSFGPVSAFGDAARHGDAGSEQLQDWIERITATPSGRGYWLLGRDGGVFAYGDAPYLGSGVGHTFGIG